MWELIKAFFSSSRIVLILGLIMGLALTCFIGGWKVCSWKYKSSYQASYDNMVRNVNARESEKQVSAKKYNQLLIQYQQIMQKESLNAKNPIPYFSPANCVVPPTGVQYINAAIATPNKN